MKCRSCGADVPSEALRCPYCGKENPSGISFFKKLSEKREANRRLRAEILERSREEYVNHMLNRTLIMLGVILFLAMAVSMGVEAYISGMHFFNSKARKQEMQQYYEAGEYTKLHAYMSDRGLFGQENYVFSRISLLSYRYDDFLMERNECMESIRKGELPAEELISDTISCASEVLYPDIPAYSEVHEEDKKVTQEQSKAVCDFLQGVFGFEEEELDFIEQSIEYGRLEDEACVQLSQKAVSYLKGQQDLGEDGADK